MTSCTTGQGEQNTAMFREAAETADRVAEQFAANRAALTALGKELRARPPQTVVTCARGSSDHAATYAKYLIETELGLVTASAAPSVASVYAVRQQLENTVFLTISQSGRSPDLVASAEAAKAAGARVIALVNDTDSPLAAAAHEVVSLQAGPEKSVAATKSCLAAFAAVAHLVADWKDDGGLCRDLETLPDALKEAWSLDWSAAREPLARAQNLFVLGRGLGFAAAQEAALKLKETSAIHAEAVSAAEVLHGPMALVGADFPVLILSQNDRTQAGIIGLAQTLMARKAKLIVAGFAPEGALNLPTRAVPAWLQPLVLLISFYRLANGVALARGRNPDSPPNLNKITETV